MALGLKKIETRHWSHGYRGPIAIHAAKRWTRDEREFWEDCCEANRALPKDLPLGAIVAVGNLSIVLPTEALLGGGRVSLLEEGWGNYGPGRFGWMFDSVVALPAPIPYKGQQGFFDVPDEVLACAVSIAPASDGPQGALFSA